MANSERVTQALFGSPVEIRIVQKKFARIAVSDGYVGWCRTSHLHQVAYAQWKKFKEMPKEKVKNLAIRVYDTNGKLKEPFILFFGTELVVKKKGKRKEFTLPGGITGLINQTALCQSNLDITRAITGNNISRLAKKFLGTPYLWGGITPFGLDCSGLVQIIYGFFDINLPRNSSDQRKSGFEINRDNLRAGDLLFFPGHVAISLGKQEIIHASASRGLVVIESLKPDSPEYRQDLDEEFICARRIPL